MLLSSVGMHPGLNLGAKLWISLKSRSNANINRISTNVMFALELDLKEIHSFASTHPWLTRMHSTRGE